MEEILIKGGYGGRLDVPKGKIIEIITVAGQQICDFFAFNAADIDEQLSPPHIRTEIRRVTLKIGDILSSRFRNPMFEIIEDTCGTHDILIPPCDPRTYEKRFNLKNHRSCLTNLAEMMADKKIPLASLPDPVNFFQNTPVLADGSIGRAKSPARPGDKVVLLALQSVIAVASACPMIGGSNRDEPSDIRLVVRDR
jgi:uncharacterized protein